MVTWLSKVTIYYVIPFCSRYSTLSICALASGLADPQRNFLCCTFALRGYDEVGWAERMASPVPPPATTVERFPDPVSHRLTLRRYHSVPAAWQVRVGRGSGKKVCYCLEYVYSLSVVGTSNRSVCTRRITFVIHYCTCIYSLRSESCVITL